MGHVLKHYNITMHNNDNGGSALASFALFDVFGWVELQFRFRGFALVIIF